MTLIIIALTGMALIWLIPFASFLFVMLLARLHRLVFGPTDYEIWDRNRLARIAREIEAGDR